ASRAKARGRHRRYRRPTRWQTTKDYSRTLGLLKCSSTASRCQRSRRWRRLLSLLVLVPWALPGTVVAVSVAEAYGGPSLLLGSFVLVGTFWILPVVYFLRFMPLVVRALQASMEQVDPTLEEAAG